MPISKWPLTMRGTWTPWYDEATASELNGSRGLWHVGGAYSYRTDLGYQRRRQQRDRHELPSPARSLPRSGDPQHQRLACRRQSVVRLRNGVGLRIVLASNRKCSPITSSNRAAPK